jgi:hypothetical protein
VTHLEPHIFNPPFSLPFLLSMTVMSTFPVLLTQPYLSDRRCLMSHQYNNPSIPLHPQDQQHLSHSMQPPPSSPIPIDPALALYSSSYYPYHSQPQQHSQVPQQLSLVTGLSSPSSQASDAMSTPPTEQISFSGSGKRPSSTSALDNDNDTSKRRKEDDGTTPSVDGSEPKAKPTRGSRSVVIPLQIRLLISRATGPAPSVAASK